MTIVTMAPSTTCPAWCNGFCRSSEPNLHTSSETTIAGADVALSRDDDGDRVTCVWVNDLALPLNDAEAVAQEILRLVEMGRRP